MSCYESVLAPSLPRTVACALLLSARDSPSGLPPTSAPRASRKGGGTPTVASINPNTSPRYTTLERPRVRQRLQATKYVSASELAANVTIAADAKVVPTRARFSGSPVPAFATSGPSCRTAARRWASATRAYRGTWSSSATAALPLDLIIAPAAHIDMSPALPV